MPNSYQYLFLSSFALTFGSLFLVSSYVSSWLSDRDIHIRNLILLGLPKDPQHPEMDFHAIQDYVKSIDIQAILDSIKNFDVQTLKNMTASEALELAQTPAALLSFGVVAFTYFFVSMFSGPRRPVLNPNEWKSFPLVLKEQISPNTAIYRFALPNSNDVLGLPIGQHVQISAEINGKEIMRSYTPTSSDEDLGHFDLLIKTYEKGNISRHFSLLKIGDRIRVKGPKGQFVYTRELTSHIGMIAGGTGITPMYQIIRASVWDNTDGTVINLIYANVNEEDILMKHELDELSRGSAGRFNVYYVLNNPPPGWTGGVGFVSKEHILQKMPERTLDCKILMCGPPPMMTAMKKHLEDLKYSPPRTVSKLADQVFLF